MRRPAEAAEAARRALALAPELPGARAVLAGALLKLGHFQEARTEAQRVLAGEPGNFHMLLVASMAAAQSGDVAAAVERVDRAFQARTGDPELRGLLRRMLIDFGESFVAIGRRDDGVERLERALELDRESGISSPATRALEQRIEALRTGR
jgi:predicted Zn-dependent protease